MYLAALTALPLSGCNSVPSNCKELAKSILSNSFKDAPSNNGKFIRHIYLSKVDTGSWSDPSLGIPNSYTLSSYYVLSIDTSGNITEGWWSAPPGSYGVLLKKNPAMTDLPAIPEPEMKTSDGIVCRMGVADTEVNYNNGQISAGGSNAVVTQNNDGYSIRY